MRTTIDAAGRIVVPKALRDRVGLVPGPVEVTSDGASLRVEPGAGDGLEERGGRLVLPAADGEVITDEAIAILRDADRR